MLNNKNWPYERDGLISKHYFYTWPLSEPPESWQYNRDGLVSLDLISSRMHCTNISSFRNYQGGLPLMTSANISDFLTPSPLVCKFMQPPLLRLLSRDGQDHDLWSWSWWSRSFGWSRSIFNWSWSFQLILIFDLEFSRSLLYPTLTCKLWVILWLKHSIKTYMMTLYEIKG